MHAVLTAENYSPRTIRDYQQEMRFLFVHHCDLLPQSIVSKDIIAYINIIVKEHGIVLSPKLVFFVAVIAATCVAEYFKHPVFPAFTGIRLYGFYYFLADEFFKVS